METLILWNWNYFYVFQTVGLKEQFFINAFISHGPVWMAHPHNLLTLLWPVLMWLCPERVTNSTRGTAPSHHLLQPHRHSRGPQSTQAANVWLFIFFLSNDSPKSPDIVSGFYSLDTGAEFMIVCADGGKLSTLRRFFVMWKLEIMNVRKVEKQMPWAFNVHGGASELWVWRKGSRGFPALLGGSSETFCVFATAGVWKAE